MTFNEPRVLFGLLVLPLAIAIHWLALRRGERCLGVLAGTLAAHPLLAQRRAGDRRLGATVSVLALGLLIVGAAGPEWGRELTRRHGSGSDVVMLVDCSASMDARDISPSRLDEARREALALLDRLEGSRVSTVAFAGDAVRLVPLTLDLSAVRLTLETLSSQSVTEPGTDLGRALRMAMRVLPRGRREEQVVILWTDGEDLEAGARAAMEELAASGIRVFVVGVGTATGDVVPQLDDDGRVVDIKRDDAGTAVRTRLDEVLLRALARRTHGGYFAATRAGGELPRLLSALSGIERSSRGSRLVERRVSRFPLFAATAALLLAFSLVRPRRKVDATHRKPKRARRADPATARGVTRTSSQATRPSRGAARAALPVAVGLALVNIVCATPARAQSDWARGNGAFQGGEFARAESLYALRARQSSPPELRLNRATARALAGERAAAAAELEKLSGVRGRAGHEARFNLGTVLGELGDYDRAIEKLREALVRDPRDVDARWNYEIMLRRRERARDRARTNPGDTPPPEPPQQQSPSPSAANPASSPPPDPQAGGSPKPAPGVSGEQGMTREQAQQLLGALDELARSDRQRQQKVRVLRDRRGRDW